MSNKFSSKDLQIVNTKFEKVTSDKTNVGITPYNMLLGRNINVPNDFKGVVIGDFVQPDTNGIYIGKNVKITEDGIIEKYTIIDGGNDIYALDLMRTNIVDIIDGTNDTQPNIKGDIMPIYPLYNWGRPIIDCEAIDTYKSIVVPPAPPIPI